MGSEKESEYVQIAKQRIESYFQGNLKLRPLGKPVHVPTGREKVAQKPEEWDRLFERKNKYGANQT